MVVTFDQMYQNTVYIERAFWSTLSLLSRIYGKRYPVPAMLFTTTYILQDFVGFLTGCSFSFEQDLIDVRFVSCCTDS